MRGARIKMQLSDGYYHLYNRAAGCPGDFPFGDVEREQLVRLVTDLARFYVIEPIDYTIMSNHFHLVVFAPGKVPSPSEAAARYNAYYPTLPPLPPTAPECARQAERMRDISEFMKDLQQKFSCWYNRSRTGGRRRGTLWAERFKSNLIEGQSGLWTLAKYVILNPWRAEMVEDPADYRWSSWGSWNGSGRHPFEDALQCAVARDLAKTLRVEAVDAQVQAVEPCFCQRFCVARQEEAIARERHVFDAIERLELGDELGNISADQRLTSSEPDLLHTARCEHSDRARDLVPVEELGVRGERISLRRHTVDAAKVAALCE